MGSDVGKDMSSETPAVREGGIVIIDEGSLSSMIYVVRGQQVMLDFELAEIYGYTTSRFNEQVKNNAEKFDEDFAFRLTKEEFENLMSKKSTSSWGGRRKSPMAFTEQGVYMLMTVLRGELATRQSKALVRTFKRMKDHIVQNQGLLGEREYLRLSMQTSQNVRDIMELRGTLASVEDKVAGVVDALGEVVTKSELSDVLLDFGEPAIRRDYLLLNGRPVEAGLAYKQMYSIAKESIFVIDNYIGLKTLVLLKDVAPGVEAIVFSDNMGRGLHRSELEDFNREYPDVHVSLRSAGGIFHDRYVVVDYGCGSEKIYHCGASSKDAGKKVTTISEVAEREVYRPLIEKLLTQPELELREAAR
jgi:hypothetical protein